jgi:DNA-directed RNA polymerase beta' subunit
VSELVGFDRLDRIIGFKIASSSYITIEMDMDNMELLKAIKEMLAEMKSVQEEVKANQAKADTNREERNTERRPTEKKGRQK